MLRGVFSRSVTNIFKLLLSSSPFTKFVFLLDSIVETHFLLLLAEEEVEIFDELLGFLEEVGDDLVDDDDDDDDDGDLEHSR